MFDGFEWRLHGSIITMPRSDVGSCNETGVQIRKKRDLPMRANQTFGRCGRRGPAVRWLRPFRAAGAGSQARHHIGMRPWDAGLDEFLQIADAPVKAATSTRPHATRRASSAMCTARTRNRATHGVLAAAVDGRGS